MFGKGVRLFKLFGFEVRIDASWLLLAVLIVLTLTTGQFPSHYRNLSTATYWWMGIIGAIGLFASIIFHEMCHSLVARRFGITMKGISLFVFGGIAHMEEESRDPKGEFFMALAGPVASFFLAGMFYVVFQAGKRLAFPLPVIGVVEYLAWINMVVAIFNLLPAFPLDGGRILRSALWAWKKNLRWATHIASSIGSGFGVVLIVLGLFAILSGTFVGGLWWCLIGMFLRGISQMSYQQVLLRSTLHGEKVQRLMRREPIAAPPDISLEQLVNEYIYEHHFKMFPVVDNNGALLGCISTREVKNVPREEWPQRQVREVLSPCDKENSISPHAEAVEALSVMNRTGNSRLMVVENGRVVGIVALKDMLKFLSLKLDLEGASSKRSAAKEAITEP